MGQKVNPHGLRVGIIKDWDTQWYADKKAFSVNLKEDYVISSESFDDALFVTIVTDKGTAKRIKLEEFDCMSRARRGVLVVRDVKTNPYHIINTFISQNKKEIGVLTSEISYHKITEFPICDRYQTGTQFTKEKIEKVFSKTEINEAEEAKEEISLDKVDEQILTIDDFLEDYESSQPYIIAEKYINKLKDGDYSYALEFSGFVWTDFAQSKECLEILEQRYKNKNIYSLVRRL